VKKLHKSSAHSQFLLINLAVMRTHRIFVQFVFRFSASMETGMIFFLCRISLSHAELWVKKSAHNTSHSAELTLVLIGMLS
jgi:hypothetical protein